MKSMAPKLVVSRQTAPKEILPLIQHVHHVSLPEKKKNKNKNN